MRTSTRLFGAVAVAGLVAASGSAFTASSTFAQSTTTGGFGGVSVSGATVKTVDYTLNADGTQISSAALLFVGDQRGKNVQAGFGTVADKTCTAGTYTADDATTTTVNEETTAYSCASLAQAVSGASTFNVSVVS